MRGNGDRRKRPGGRGGGQGAGRGAGQGMGRGGGGGTGRGGGQGAGQGMGRGGGGGTGQGGMCVCPSCGERLPHKRGVPCFEESCPKCGKSMCREDTAHADSDRQR
jgi:hypothetical protein